MTTTWLPMFRPEPRQWLLANGEVISEPALEVTGSDRKVRVAGTTSSVFKSSLNDLLNQAADTLAAQKQTTVWLELHQSILKHLEDAWSHKTATIKAKLHLIHETERPETSAWWRFKDPDSMYEVLVVASMATQRYGNTGMDGQVTNIRAYVPVTTDNRRWGGSASATEVQYVETHNYGEVVDDLARRSGDLCYKWQEFARDNPPQGGDVFAPGLRHPTAHQAVSAYLKSVRAIESLDALEVPDLRSDTPQWLALQPFDSNVNAELINDLSEYLEGETAVDKITSIYADLSAALRASGIAVAPKSKNDFATALLSGDSPILNMQVTSVSDDSGQNIDRDHTLSMHLPTGTFIVECSHRAATRDEVAEKWEEAVTLASLTGAEDELLAYARAYGASHTKQRTQTILAARGAI